MRYDQQIENADQSSKPRADEVTADP